MFYAHFESWRSRSTQRSNSRWEESLPHAISGLISIPSSTLWADLGIDFRPQRGPDHRGAQPLWINQRVSDFSKASNVLEGLMISPYSSKPLKGNSILVLTETMRDVRL